MSPDLHPLSHSHLGRDRGVGADGYLVGQLDTVRHHRRRVHPPFDCGRWHQHRQQFRERRMRIRDFDPWQVLRKLAGELGRAQQRRGAGHPNIPEVAPIGNERKVGRTSLLKRTDPGDRASGVALQVAAEQLADFSERQRTP